jgi:hypothetical protein
MGKAKPVSSLQVETRYWKSLTDEQLLNVSFRADDPASLEGVLHELPLIDETPFVEFAYNTKTGSGQKVRCVHCRYDNHNRGFVLRFRDATRILVGKDCGKKIYGADFDLIEKDFDAAKDRAYYLRCKRSTLAAAPAFRAALESLRSDPALTKFQEVKRRFNTAMSSLARELAKAVQHSDGALYVDDLVRDFEAEARREEQQEILVQQLATMTKTAVRKAREDGRLPRKGAGLKFIFKRVPKHVGSIRGQTFFRTDQEPPRERIEQLSVRVLHSLDALPSSTLTTSQLRVVFRDLSQIVDALVGEIDRLADVLDAFDAGNLARIARWATTRSEDQTVYTATVGQLALDGPSHEQPRVVRVPADYRPPSREPFMAFRAALSSDPTIPNR